MSDWDNYSENLAFDPANSMPRCDIDELKAKVRKLEEKLKIAVKALEFYAIPLSQLSPVYNIAQHYKRAQEALAKIKEIK